MKQYSIEPRTRNYIKGYGFLSSLRNLSNKYRKTLLDTGLVTIKTASKNVVQKAAQETIEFIGNEIANKIVKIKPIIDENSRNVEEFITPLEERE